MATSSTVPVAPPGALAPRPMFPRWANYLLPVVILGLLGAGVYAPTFMWYGMSPITTDVGYAPDQPIHYSHALHVGQLGMDCRYCHTTVEQAGYAAVPAAQTCMNCHHAIKKNAPDGTLNPKLAPLHEAWATGKPIDWVKVHDLPDYSYFNHATHVNKGVSCVSCHGRIDRMEVVYQAQPLNMAWCLECHREPEKHLRPADKVTDLKWTVADLKQTHPEIHKQLTEQLKGAEVTQEALGLHLKEKMQIKGSEYMTACSTCHR